MDKRTQQYRKLAKSAGMGFDDYLDMRSKASKENLRQIEEENKAAKRAYEVARHGSRVAAHQAGITGYMPDELDFSPEVRARKQRELAAQRHYARMVHAQGLKNAEEAAKAAEKTILAYENSFPGTVARVLRRVLNKPLKKQELEALESDSEDFKFKFASRKRSHVRLASRKRSPAKLKLAARKRSHVRLSFCKA